MGGDAPGTARSAWGLAMYGWTCQAGQLWPTLPLTKVSNAAQSSFCGSILSFTCLSTRAPAQHSTSTCAFRRRSVGGHGATGGQHAASVTAQASARRCPATHAKRATTVVIAIAIAVADIPGTLRAACSGAFLWPQAFWKRADAAGAAQGAEHAEYAAFEFCPLFGVPTIEEVVKEAAEEDEAVPAFLQLDVHLSAMGDALDSLASSLVDLGTNSWRAGLSRAQQAAGGAAGMRYQVAAHESSNRLGRHEEEEGDDAVGEEGDHTGLLSERTPAPAKAQAKGGLLRGFSAPAAPDWRDGAEGVELAQRPLLAPGTPFTPGPAPPAAGHAGQRWAGLDQKHEEAGVVGAVTAPSRSPSPQSAAEVGKAVVKQRRTSSNTESEANR